MSHPRESLVDPYRSDPGASQSHWLMTRNAFGVSSSCAPLANDSVQRFRGFFILLQGSFRAVGGGGGGQGARETLIGSSTSVILGGRCTLVSFFDEWQGRRCTPVWASFSSWSFGLYSSRSFFHPLPLVLWCWSCPLAHWSCSLVKLNSPLVPAHWSYCSLVLHTGTLVLFTSQVEQPTGPCTLVLLLTGPAHWHTGPVH